MSNPIQINEQTAKGLRKYFYEYVLFALTAAVMYLFYLYISLNVFIRDTLNEQLQKSNDQIHQNNIYLNLKTKQNEN